MLTCNKQIIKGLLNKLIIGNSFRGTYHINFKYFSVFSSASADNDEILHELKLLKAQEEKKINNNTDIHNSNTCNKTSHRNNNNDLDSTDIIPPAVGSPSVEVFNKLRSTGRNR